MPSSLTLYNFEMVCLLSKSVFLTFSYISFVGNMTSKVISYGPEFLLRTTLATSAR